MTELGIGPADRGALVAGEHTDPHAVLGPHVLPGPARPGVIVRAWHPDAERVECVLDGGAKLELKALGDGLFAVLLPRRKRVPRYSLRFHFGDGNCWEHGDPYRFSSTLDQPALAGLAAGTHRRLWQALGAHVMSVAGCRGTRFAVWAPNARAVRLVGDFCAWDGRLLPMRVVGSGVFELFVPGVEAGARYRFEILTTDGLLRLKSDPVGFAMDPPPAAASRVVDERFGWTDRAWMRRRAAGDVRAQPVSIYEVHLGSWDRDGDRRLSFRELAPRLAAHARRFGFTHLELMPVAEHAFYGSWGYQITGFYAVTGRYGTPADLRWFVDHCHRQGVGVILDWVPAHFAVDDYALRHFDGPRLYEAGEHPSWGTLRFDYTRPEVRSFLLSNALYWLREFHIDALRVDAVSWVIYTDYLEGEEPWTPDAFGIALVREINTAVAEEVPGAFVVAEEATSFAGVTSPVAAGGLGFTFKWNMGWMNDTLAYFALDPGQRGQHQDQLTFAMSYEFDECFVNPLSHDEVVHLKRSLLGKMPGEPWQQFANLRLLLAYQFLRPGKKLLFMGSELAPETEWNHDVGLDWALAETAERRQLLGFVEELGALYRGAPCLWRRDASAAGFVWIDGSDTDNCVLSFVRRDGDEHLLVVLHLRPGVCEGYRIGVPAAGSYREVLSSDAARFGGTGVEIGALLVTEDEAHLGWEQSIVLDLPPLAAVVLEPTKVRQVQAPPAGAIPGA